jgi:predicted outer membrane protein
MQSPSTSGQTQRPGSIASSPRQSDNASQEVESFLAQCLLIKNQNEVELAQFAAQRSQNPQVKQFAQMLIEDHQTAIQRLQNYSGTSQQDRNIRPAGYTGQEGGRQSSASNQPRFSQNSGTNEAGDRSRNEPSSATGQSGTRMSGDDSTLRELANIQRQVAERSQQALREKLQSKQGAEFDQCFVGSQIFGHMHMLSELEVVQQQASGQLRQFAQESQPKVKQHLDQAERLAEQLMESSTRQAGAQQPGQGTQR